MKRWCAWIHAVVARAGWAPLGLAITWGLTRALLGPPVDLSFRDLILHGVGGMALAHFFASASRCEESEFFLGRWTRAKGFTFTVVMLVAGVLGWELVKALSDRIGWSEFQRGVMIFDWDVGASIVGGLAYLVIAIGSWPQSLSESLVRRMAEGAPAEGRAGAKGSAGLPVELVGFHLEDPARLDALVAFTQELARAKSDTGGKHDAWERASRWESRLNPEAKSVFLPWDAVPVEPESPDLTDPGHWPLGSLVQAFMDGDYVLLGVRELGEVEARGTASPHGLEYIPGGWPFGGTACMHALIRGFGGRVEYDSQGKLAPTTDG